MEATIGSGPSGANTNSVSSGGTGARTSSRPVTAQGNDYEALINPELSVSAAAPMSPTAYTNHGFRLGPSASSTTSAQGVEQGIKGSNEEQKHADDFVETGQEDGNEDNLWLNEEYFDQPGQNLQPGSAFEAVMNTNADEMYLMSGALNPELEYQQRENQEEGTQAAPPFTYGLHQESYSGELISSNPDVNYQINKCQQLQDMDIGSTLPYPLFNNSFGLNSQVMEQLPQGSYFDLATTQGEVYAQTPMLASTDINSEANIPATSVFTTQATIPQSHPPQIDNSNINPYQPYQAENVGYLPVQPELGSAPISSSFSTQPAQHPATMTTPTAPIIPMGSLPAHPVASSGNNQNLDWDAITYMPPNVPTYEAPPRMILPNDRLYPDWAEVSQSNTQTASQIRADARGWRNRARWFPQPSNPTVLPDKNDEAVESMWLQRYFEPLFDSFVDLSAFHDRTSSGNKLNKLVTQSVPVRDIEAAVWNTLEIMLALHRDGATCPIWMDPTMEPDTRLKPSVNPKSIPDEVLLQDNRKTLEDRDLSFDERFQEICLTVREHKSAALDIIEGIKPWAIIYAPKYSAKVKMENAKNNLQKAAKAERNQHAFDREHGLTPRTKRTAQLGQRRLQHQPAQQPVPVAPSTTASSTAAQNPATATQTQAPMNNVTAQGNAAPTAAPTAAPMAASSTAPTATPAAVPMAAPVVAPTAAPMAVPVTQPGLPTGAQAQAPQPLAGEMQGAQAQAPQPSAGQMQGAQAQAPPPMSGQLQGAQAQAIQPTAGHMQGAHHHAPQLQAGHMPGGYQIPSQPQNPLLQGATPPNMQLGQLQGVPQSALQSPAASFYAGMQNFNGHDTQPNFYAPATYQSLQPNPFTNSGNMGAMPLTPYPPGTPVPMAYPAPTNTNADAGLYAQAHPLQPQPTPPAQQMQHSGGLARRLQGHQPQGIGQQGHSRHSSQQSHIRKRSTNEAGLSDIGGDRQKRPRHGGSGGSMA